MQDFKFDPPLAEAVIVRRRSQFTMTVLLDGQELAFRCPTTGRIGNLDVSGRPCLVSLARGGGRKTAGTVEAVSLARPEDADKSWIGINQNAANRYVEHYLRNGGFADIVGTGHGDDVRREVFLGESKLDFLVGDVFLEETPPRVEYASKQAAKDLRPVFDAMWKWGEGHAEWRRVDLRIGARQWNSRTSGQRLKG